MPEIDGFLAELLKDQATYDLRNWRKAGITPEEIRIRLEHPELCSGNFDKTVPEDHFPNVSGSRLFGYVWKELQKLVPSCVDKVIETIMSHKAEGLKKWADYLKFDGDRFYKSSVSEDVDRLVSAIDLFRQNPKTARNLLFAVEHLEGFVQHAKDHEAWRKATVEALGEPFAYAEWFKPLVDRAESLLSSVNKSALIELEKNVRATERTSKTEKKPRTKKPKTTTKPIGEILSQVSPTQPTQDAVLEAVREMEKETHGRTFDEVRATSTPECRTPKEIAVSFREMFKVGEPEPPLNVNDYLLTGNDQLIGKIVEITIEEHLEGPTYLVETPQGNREKMHFSYLASVKAKVRRVKSPTDQVATPTASKSTCRTLVEKGTFPTKPEAEAFAKTIQGKTDIQPLYGSKQGWFAVYEVTEEKTSQLSPDEVSQIHDYFTLNLEDAKIDPTQHEEEFKKALDPNKTWQENLEIMDKQIQQIQSHTQTQTQTQPQTPLPMLSQPEKRLALPEPSIPEVKCNILVQGGADPADRYQSMYFVLIVPKGLTFPEDFFIGRAFEDTEALEEYLKEGVDYYSEEETVAMSGDDEWEKELLAKLPAPFNTETDVWLKWEYPVDVEFDKPGQILWAIHGRTFTKEELQAYNVGELKVREKLLKGMLDIVVLRLINEHGFLHGYEIIKTIRQRYGVYFSPSTIYPLLAQLERKGYVESEWRMAETKRPIKTYTLTVKGKTEMETSQTELKIIVMPLCTVQEA